MQSMSALLASIYTNFLINTGFVQLAKQLRNDHKVNNIGDLTSNFFPSLRNATENWIVEFMKCCS